MSKKTARKTRAAAPEKARLGQAAVPNGAERHNSVKPIEAARFNKKETGGGAAKSRALWFLAAVFIVSGYALLSKADPRGQNGWAILSPALLLFGYLLIIPAISHSYRRQ